MKQCSQACDELCYPSIDTWKEIPPSPLGPFAELAMQKLMASLQRCMMARLGSA